MSQNALNALKIEKNIYEDETSAIQVALANAAQKIVEQKWGFVRSNPIDRSTHFFERIRGWKTDDLVSSENRVYCNNRSNSGKAYASLARKSDFLVLFDGRVEPMNSIACARSNRFGYNFYPKLLIVYYPEFEEVAWATYTDYSD